MALLMGGWETGPTTDRPCPTCETAMHRVHISVDDDEVMDPRAPGHFELCQLDAEVCRTCLFVWLDAGELEQLPVDRPNAEFAATVEQQSVLDQIRRDTEAELERRYQELDRHDLAERILRRLRRLRKAA